MTVEVISPAYDVLDERFLEVRGDERLDPLYDGRRWAEGPCYVPAGRYLLFNDIPEDRMLRWDETTGAVGVFRQPSGYANGNTLDRQGRLVTCEQGARRVTRTEHDGRITVLADWFEAKRLNSPNDVVVKSDGSIWFTDPSYGIDSDYEDCRAPAEIGTCNVYRIDPHSGNCRIVADDFSRPNGLAFSADETALFVADTERITSASSMLARTAASQGARCLPRAHTGGSTDSGSTSAGASGLPPVTAQILIG